MDKLPASQPLTVIPADEPKVTKLNWVVRERLGCPISRLENGVPVQFKPGEDIKEGQEVLVSGLFGGYHPMTITKDEYGVLRAESEKLVGVLTSEMYEENNEPIWVCTGLINNRALLPLQKVTEVK